MGQGRLALAADELRMMPDTFVDAYGALWEAALVHPESSRGNSDANIRVAPRVRRARTSTGQTETRGPAKRGKGGGSGKDVVKNEAALAAKQRIDRKLRKLTREMSLFLSSSEEERPVPRKCIRCKKYGEDEWAYCPYDGAAMMSEDRR